MKIRIIKPALDQLQQVPTALMIDREISFAAKGLYGYFMSLRDEDPVTTKDIASEFEIGYRTVLGWVKELRDTGWVMYRKYGNGSASYTLQTSLVQVEPQPDTYEEPVNTKYRTIMKLYNKHASIIELHNKRYPAYKTTQPKKVLEYKHIPRGVLPRFTFLYDNYSAEELSEMFTALKLTVKHGGYASDKSRYLAAGSLFRNAANVQRIFDFKMDKPVKNDRASIGNDHADEVLDYIRESK